jgi:hypothetical protein
MTACLRDVRFTPESGHQSEGVECPLSAVSGHRRAMRFDMQSFALAQKNNRVRTTGAFRFPHTNADTHQTVEVNKDDTNKPAVEGVHMRTAKANRPAHP